MSYNWGPFFIVPSEKTSTFSRRIVLREKFDEELLKKELAELGYSGVPFKATNPWYYHKKGAEMWIKIGESDDRENWFSVPWDTTTVENGNYEVLGQMHVLVKEKDKELVIFRQNIADVTIEN
ncbi:MAG: hypothetical protein V2A69_08705 [Pseudomonadota bacterium]